MARNLKVHYGTDGKTICNLQRRDNQWLRALKMTLNKDDVTCKRCRSTFYEKNDARKET